MELFITSLNSGSNGNCYYIGNNREAILVDAGLSCRETEKRMRLLGLSIGKVKAIFISHEHTDHIKGVQGLSEKYELPVMISRPTSKRSGLRIKNSLLRYFTEAEPVIIGQLCIEAFLKHHDAADPHSFIISCQGTTVGVFTDIGNPCDKLISNFRKCHAAFLEANYDEAMLENGRYPLHLKNRIRGGMGHLSNTQALDLFVQCKPSFMTHLFLSHLSQDNNSPELVKQLFEEHAGETCVLIASRYEPTPICRIKASAKPNHPAYRPAVSLRPEQLKLFK